MVPPYCGFHGNTAYRKADNKIIPAVCYKQTSNPPKGETDTKPTSEHPLLGGRSEQEV